MENKCICPVCGYDKLAEVPYDQYGYPSYEICPCCGFEYGFDDSSEGKTFEEYRNEWIKNGYPFYDNEVLPKNWSEVDMLKQLKNTERVTYRPRI